MDIAFYMHGVWVVFAKLSYRRSLARAGHSVDYAEIVLVSALVEYVCGLFEIGRNEYLVSILFLQLLHPLRSSYVVIHIVS